MRNQYISFDSIQACAPLCRLVGHDVGTGLPAGRVALVAHQAWSAIEARRVVVLCRVRLDAELLLFLVAEHEKTASSANSCEDRALLERGILGHGYRSYMMCIEGVLCQIELVWKKGDIASEIRMTRSFLFH